MMHNTGCYRQALTGILPSLLGLYLMTALMGWAGNPTLTQPESSPPKVISGSVEKNVLLKTLPPSFPPDTVGGEVRDSKTLQPMPGVWIDVPQLGLKTQTDAEGRFQFSRLPNGQFILSAEKQGFLPQNGIMEIDGRPTQPFYLRLQQFQNAVMIDRDLHHLGDGRYSWYSAGASEFQQDSEGIEYRRTFTVPASLKRQLADPAVKPYLHVGAVIGLDTAEANRLGQSNIGLISAPPQISLNGFELVPFRVNGVDQSVRIPKEALLFDRPNVLDIRAGYHRPRGNVDFDDFEWMTLLLRY